ncbi:MAG: hypothetical protein MJZ74_10885 [Muribaculaceae bacterium]|nr:hypothetical protein [Muribaculaceae bacterium]
MDRKNKPVEVDGLGWRYATKHRYTRRHRTHDYAGIGTYEVTFAVLGRLPVFGHVEATAHGRAVLIPSPLGKMVLQQELPKISSVFPCAQVWKIALMPDHIHIIVRINASLPAGKSLGTIIGSFKGGITRLWRQLKADAYNTGAQRLMTNTAPVSSASALDSDSLFEPGFNDRILMNDGQLENWKRYLDDNPYRLWIRQQRPHLMRRALCLVIEGTRYGAFGNFALLRHPEKHQVFFHRLTDGQPTEHTTLWQQEHDRLVALSRKGDVLVTPGISECEKRIKKEAIEHRLKLIHLQSEPITPYWKPERSRFDACAAGTLLILAPWQDDLDSSSDHASFHHLNELAASICQIGADTECRLIH